MRDGHVHYVFPGDFFRLPTSQLVALLVAHQPLFRVRSKRQPHSFPRETRSHGNASDCNTESDRCSKSDAPLDSSKDVRTPDPDTRSPVLFSPCHCTPSASTPGIETSDPDREPDNPRVATDRTGPGGFATPQHCDRSSVRPIFDPRRCTIRSLRFPADSTAYCNALRFPVRSTTTPATEADRRNCPRDCRCPLATRQAFPTGENCCGRRLALESSARD